MAKCRIVEPHNIILFRGEEWIEVEWPSDGRYDIGYQLAHEVTKKNGHRYMGLFEGALRRLKQREPQGERSE